MPYHWKSLDLRGAQYVALARRDGDNMAVGRDRRRVHVHLRVLPNLGVDQTPEGEYEGPLQQSLL